MSYSLFNTLNFISLHFNLRFIVRITCWKLTTPLIFGTSLRNFNVEPEQLDKIKRKNIEQRAHNIGKVQKCFNRNLDDSIKFEV